MFATRSEAPPAGADAAGPRPDLRGYRLGYVALVDRPSQELFRRRYVGLGAGFAVGLMIGLALLAVGVAPLLAVLPAAITNFVVALWLPMRLLDPADRRLLGVVNHAAGAAYLSWRRAFGKAPIPRSEREQLLWISARPANTTNADALEMEGSMLNLLGRYDDARDRAQRLPDDTPWRRYARAFLLAEIDYDAGGTGDLAPARAAAEGVHGDRRAAVISGLALEEANRAMIRGDDWEPPIARAAALAPAPIVVGIAATLARVPSIRGWLLASEIALGAVLYLLSNG
jgi:hypothetical protein